MSSVPRLPQFLSRFVFLAVLFASTVVAAGSGTANAASQDAPPPTIVANCAYPDDCDPAPVCPTDPALPADSPDCELVDSAAPCSHDPALPADDSGCVPCPTDPSVKDGSPDCELVDSAAPCSHDPALPADDSGCVPCPTDPSVKDGSPDCEVVSPPTVTTSPTVTTGSVQVKGSTQTPDSQVQGLPVTGGDAGTLFAAGALLVVAGVGTWAYGRRQVE